MDEKEKELIRNHFTENEPFGPIDASDVECPKTLEILFEEHNKLYKSLHGRPSIVVGRKGAGKTSYLNSVYFHTNYAYVAKLESADLLANIISAIAGISLGPTFSENVAKLWERVLYIGLFNDIRNTLPKTSRARKYINDYLAQIGIREEGTLDDVVWQIAEIISERAKNKPAGILTEILKGLDNVTFKKTKDILVEELKCKNKKAIILLDSLEDFQLQFDEVGHALQGLLKFVGKSNIPSHPIDIRLCLPTELYHRFFSISSNPNKDFKRKLILHWIAPELIMVAAHRLKLHLEANNIAYDLPVLEEAASEKKRSRAVLESILPEKITCELGVEENPLAYILRHTQLLPRHLLMLLSAIYNKNRRLHGDDLSFICEQAIIEGIKSVEELIVEEIFVAFKPIYPHVAVVCEECIPELHHKFSIGDLERIFRTHGKKAMRSDDFFDFKRMLIEIGAIGRVTMEKERYIQAVFEYTLPHKLVTSTDDLLCFHPLFTKIFSAKIREKKPVYPYGARLEDSDYRGDD